MENLFDRLPLIPLISFFWCLRWCIACLEALQGHQRLGWSLLHRACSNVFQVYRTLSGFCLVNVLIEGYCCLGMLTSAETMNKLKLFLGCYFFLFVTGHSIDEWYRKGHQCLGMVLIVKSSKRSAADDGGYFLVEKFPYYPNRLTWHHYLRRRINTLSSSRFPKTVQFFFVSDTWHCHSIDYLVCFIL